MLKLAYLRLIVLQWWNYRMYRIRILNIAYNDIMHVMRLLLRLPRHHE